MAITALGYRLLKFLHCTRSLLGKFIYISNTGIKYFVRSLTEMSIIFPLEFSSAAIKIGT